MKHAAKIVVVDRFAPLRTQLLALLAGLRQEDWARPTAAPQWCVKDVAAHLLGGDVGILSRKRDMFTPGPAIQDYAELVELINRLNRLALQCEGTFYLTYVRNLDSDTLRQAYPGIDAFFQTKHAFDPEGRFTSRFFEMHGKRELARAAASRR